LGSPKAPAESLTNTNGNRMSKKVTPAKASINFKPIKNNSKVHNERLGELDYVYSELTPNNESWKLKEISEAKAEIMDLYRSTIGQKMQEQAVPIKEAVVNIKPDTTMDDLKTLANELENRYGMQCFQIFIHRDEGFSKDTLNHHAHMVFDFQHKTNRTPEGAMQFDKNGEPVLYKRGANKGLQKPVPSTLAKTVKPNKADMSKIQDLTAEILKMERGERRENTNTVRLEAVEYKAQQEEKRQKALQEENVLLEQKKNGLEAEYRRLIEENREFERVEAEIRTDWEDVTREHERLKTREQSLNGEITKLREGIAKGRKGHREFAFGILRERAEDLRNERRTKKGIIQLEKGIDREESEIGRLERQKSFLESRYQELRRESLERDSEQDRRYRAISEELLQSPEGYNKFSEEEINGAIQWLKRQVESAEEEYERTEEEYQRQRVDIEALKAERKA
jgi:hypothetical protein